MIPYPPLEKGPWRKSVAMFAAIPALGSAALNAGCIIDLHSVSVRVEAGRGYLI